MSDTRFEPEEFERLVGLPEGDPERQRAERSSRLPAWKLMLEAFETPPDQLLPPREQAEAEAELERRVDLALARDRVPERAVRRPAEPRPSWIRGWLTGGRAAALAFASVAIIVAGWWSFAPRRESPVLRSGGEARVGEVLATPVAGAVDLRWPEVPGTLTYSVVFFGSDLDERARIDSLRTNSFRLRSDQLPSGLAPGQSLLVEVQAFRAYDQLTSKPVSITVP